MADRGFDLEEQLTFQADADRRCSLAPADRIDSRGYVSEPPRGGLPVLEADELLVFGSNNYLGLTANQRVQNAARQAAATVGTGSGGSRLTTGDTMVHHDLERLLAETFETDRALAFSSGYAANVGTITALEPDVVFVDEYTHVSAFDGCRLAGTEVVPYGHCDPDALREAVDDALERRAIAEARSNTDANADVDVDTNAGDDTDADADTKANANADADTGDESWLVVTDSVFSQDGWVAPLEELCDVADSVGAWIMVDESHATGLYVRGGGIVQAEGLADRVDIQMGALSTALASQGGYVAGDDALIEWLAARAPPFVESTGLTPMAAAAASEALHLSKHGDHRESLWENVTRLRDGLLTMGYEVDGDSQILPVYVETRDVARALANDLRDRGVIVSAPVRTRSGGHASRNEVREGYVYALPTAAHTRDDLVACLEAFQDAGEALDLL
ncbi:aminotransferase class I/II-fold pyridoxal phosphate-dependent enzyme [Natronosalvus rutilus]|uniref:Aminotransferase class I/II-fold pyridoxal phosphate-dependent enzyme n=1 Tax=Natronosalvus rutilus TaxID=2953753 RepID=A0A9E7N609_9EURY|nr:aminotransferase class I/II-fold pyridoxal phosphate-dependent enzyme [Natronosalvus rutilus]UTF52382.1 aminotransferase class I/II-fold pyridoxal phosphate-dependent enzyme [Natronosalvus rutilus]